MRTATIHANRHYVHATPIDDRLYSAFVEHLGNVIYGGIYDPAHPTANEDGFRQDVIDLVRELGLTTIRYPGGNYICTYNWEDTVGPVEERPIRADPAWRAREPNTVGLAEFERWVKAINSELAMAVNMSTRGVQDAANVVEYCNLSGDTHYARLRSEHGHAEPYGIKLWYVGNEVDGPWQIARRRADAYGWDAAEACKAMRRIDPDVELVAVGSAAPSLDTFLTWDRTVLEHAYDECDYLSIHIYFGIETPEDEGNVHEYLALARRMERQIEDTIAACDYVKGVRRSQKTMYISFDEYNVIPATMHEARAERVPWTTGTGGNASLTMQNSLLFAMQLLTLMRHSDRVRIACQSILINGAGLVLCSPDSDAWVNANYFIMQHVSRYGRGRLVSQVYDGPTYESEAFGTVESVDSVCVYHDDTGEIDIFAVNRESDDIELRLELSAFTDLDPIEHLVLKGETLQSCNSAQQPDAVTPAALTDLRVEQGTVVCALPAYSWNVVRLQSASDCMRGTGRIPSN